MVSKEKIDYIAGWIIEEVITYKGDTIGCELKELNDYDQETLGLAITSAIDAWNGGARDG